MMQRKHPKFRRLPAFLLALFLCLTLAAPALAADDATASSIQLAKTEGTVSATNSAGRSISLVKNLRLFNGYHVVTEAKSYAWLNLDSAKLLKEDASSNVEVRKSGKKLEVLLSSGNLYFNVTEPLDDDETLNIRTSTTLTGIRGTCGWVEVIDRWNTEVYILEGKVECVVTDPVSGENELTTISAGETATFTVRSGGGSATNGVKVTKTSCDVEDVPGYVLVELAEDRTLCDEIRDASGLDILGELSRNGDAAAEAQRRLEEEEAGAARRLSTITAREQAQANNVESAANPSDTTNPDGLTMVGDWGWRFDNTTKTLYIGGTGAMTDFVAGTNEAPWLNQYSGEMRSAVISAGITKIGDYAFNGCDKLTSVTIPNGVTSIGTSAFQACSSLTGVTIPNGVTSIGNSAFWASGLTSVTIPNSVTSIGSCAFYRCSGLASVTIPDSVTSIGYGAFYSCSSLTSITVPNRVTSIENAAFQNCTGLKSVTIPDSVTSIENAAFDGCRALSDVYYGGSAAQWSAIAIGSDNTPLTGANIHYAVASTTPTDGDRIVLTGTVRMCSYADLVELSGGVDPNGGYGASSGKTQVIVLDTPQELTLRSGDGLGSYTSEAKCITVYSPGNVSGYDGKNITFSIDPAKTYWPSGTDLPLGQPSTNDIYVFSWVS